MFGPSKTWYSDSSGWVRDVRSIFNVAFACLIIFHHITEGNFSPHVLRPATVWILNISIASSEAFTWWLCSSVGFIMMFSYSRYLLTALGATLSMMLIIGLKPLFVKYVMLSLKVDIVDVSLKCFTGVGRVSYDNQSYSTNIAVFPSIALNRNFPVKSTYMVPFFGLVSYGMRIGNSL